MVLPLIDEDKPKCYICHEGFSDIEHLRDHQKAKHYDFFEGNQTNNTKKDPAPGDVTVF